MDLNIRKAGNLLLKASKEATPVVKALGTGIKAGGEAAITSYNNNKNLAKKCSSRTGQIHSSRNVESESENCNCLRLPATATETVCNCLRNGKRQGLRSALNFCSNVS